MRRSVLLSSLPLAFLALLAAFGFAVIPALGAVKHGHANRGTHASAHASAASKGKAVAKAKGQHASRSSANHISTRGHGQVAGRRSVHAAMRGRRFRIEKSPAHKLQQVRLAMPPPLRGSYESLVHQNVMAEADGLERIQDDNDLADRVAHGSLVPVPSNSGIHVNTDLPDNRRYCRPWTAKFLSDLAAAHAAKFPGNAMEVTSAVRTVEFQRQLRRYNGNAAAAEGDVASPHLTGGTIDLAKQGLTQKEIGWLRGWLIPLEQAGKIDVAEEFKQACFHISVYKGYTAPRPDPKAPAKSGPLASGSMLAAHGR